MQKPIKVIRYDQEVWETEVFDSLRKDHCMCHHCDKMKPGEPDHCPIANAFYQICKENGNAFILTRCASWKEKSDGEV